MDDEMPTLDIEVITIVREGGPGGSVEVRAEDLTSDATLSLLAQAQMMVTLGTITMGEPE